MVKSLSLLLSLLLVLPSGALDVKSPPSLTVQPTGVSPVRSENEDESSLRAVRMAGGATAGAGMGLLGYAAIAEVSAGPLGWAFALIFFGTITLYLAQRGLNGEHDFSPGPPPLKKTEPTENETPSEPQSSTDTRGPTQGPAI